MNTVEEAVGDVEGLHSKIDRKKNVESGNEVAFKDFQKVKRLRFHVFS